MPNESLFCSDCLTETDVYYRFKTLYERTKVDGKQKWVKTGIYKCEQCGRVAVEDQIYKEMRANNNHIIKKLSTYLEE